MMMQTNYITSNNSNTSSHQACASCKHQRKKCNEECILAPYFPAIRTKEFRAIHKVFGVSNVQKIIRFVKNDERKKVADSLIWEAFWRQKDPVLGPYGEYKRICDELRLYKTLIQPMIGMNVNHHMINSNENNSFDNKNNNGLNVNHDNEKHMIDSASYNRCSSLFLNGLEKPMQEREVGPMQLQQDYSVHGFNQQYHLSGQFGLINSKIMEGRKI